MEKIFIPTSLKVRSQVIIADGKAEEINFQQLEELKFVPVFPSTVNHIISMIYGKPIFN